ncbi:superoxide dismutase family protein [Roseitranquillus sediminis]|uniref:superoxide dismutase family protein n=1 Tax=Roseitranquillus sediminis TaxID=2809051 RepID=UPI001D0C9E9F|nr:superoxide dismutase family protein [Roseitranquillus sediminis]MBM9595293.1 superoxide dismutase family protein [Roseitranquillus sediminis]
MKYLLSTLAAATIAGSAYAQSTPTAQAPLQNREGAEIGNATFYETASGLTWVVVQATGISTGIHGVHVHETGDCSAEDFSSAGGHLAGDAQHGVLVEGGPHPGDLPNAHVQDDGVLALEAFKSNLPLSDDLVFDDDGAAVVIHSGADDYQSQPSGESGDRIACGVISREGS